MTFVISGMLLLASAPAELPSAFQAAEAIWKASKDLPEYQTYSSEFIKFNNQFQLDTRDGCYALGKEIVGLMLVVTSRDSGRFAVVEQVLSGVDSEKARCFMKSYKGIRLLAPPFNPFVLQMTMD